MPGPTAAVELLPVRRWPSRVKRSDTLREILQGCGPAPGNRTEVGGYSRPAKNRRSAQDIWIFDDHAVPRAHTISITHSIALSSGTFPYLSLAKIITVAMLQRPRLGVGQSFGEPQGQARRVYSGRSVPCLGCTRSMLRWHLSICTGIRIEASDLDDDQSSSRRVSSPAASVLL